MVGINKYYYYYYYYYLSIKVKQQQVEMRLTSKMQEAVDEDEAVAA